MKKRTMTVDDLAGMVQKGLSHVESRMDEQFQEVRLELRAIRKEVADVIHRSEFDRLDERVKELEDMLAMPRKKVVNSQ